MAEKATALFFCNITLNIKIAVSSCHFLPLTQAQPIAFPRHPDKIIAAHFP
jgi:hypothetical protein